MTDSIYHQKRGQYVEVDALAHMFGLTKAAILSFCNKGMPNVKVGNNVFYYSGDCFKWKMAWERAAEKQRIEKMAERKGTESGPASTYNQAKARKEAATAEMAELTLAKAKGEVANIDDLMNNFQIALVEVRAKLVSQSSRLAGILSHQEGDEIREILDKDAKDTLESLSDYEHVYS